MKNEIVIYQINKESKNIEVKVEEETLWLTQNQIVELFDSSKANISEHIKNIFQTKELDEKATVRKIRTVQIEGGREVSRLFGLHKSKWRNFFKHQEIILLFISQTFLRKKNLKKIQHVRIPH